MAGRRVQEVTAHVARLLIIQALIVGIHGEIPHVVWEKRGVEVIDKGVAVSANGFGVDRAVGMAHGFLAKHKEKVARFVIMTGGRDDYGLRASGGSDWSFLSWKQAYQNHPRDLPPAAEVIRVGERSTIRFRLSGGKLYERSLVGESPLKIRFRGQDGELAGVAATISGLTSLVPHMFVQMANPWPIEVAEAYVKHLRRSTGVEDLIVDFENGWWFAGDEDYVTYNRFRPYWPAPSLQEYLSATRFTCYGVSGTCQQWGPHK